MKSSWTAFTNSKELLGAKKVVKNIFEKMEVEVHDVEINTYHKDGFKIDFSIDHNYKNWNDMVVECIALGQRTGFDWQLFGDIYQDPSALTTKANLSGIEMIEWRIIKTEN